MTGGKAPGARILVVNAGSSSLKLRVLDPADEVTRPLISTHGTAAPSSASSASS